MRKSSVLLQLTRQAQTPASILLGAPLRRTFAQQLPKQASRSLPSGARGFATSPLRISRTLKPWRAAFRKRWQTRPNSTQAPDSQAPKTLSARMKEMSRKYGWTVTGIYLGLSVLDFPFCFLAVRMFGTERIAEIEHKIVDGFWGILEKVAPSLKERRQNKEATTIQDAAAAAREAGDSVAEQAKHKDPGKLSWSEEHARYVTDNHPGLGTQLLLAYGVHKSLIFFRIPLTLAITPKVVKTLRSWGWKIGKSKTV